MLLFLVNSFFDLPYGQQILSKPKPHCFKVPLSKINWLSGNHMVVISQACLVCFLFWIWILKCILKWRRFLEACGELWEAKLAALLESNIFSDKGIGREEKGIKHNNRNEGLQKSLTAPKKVPSPSRDILALLRGIVSWSSSPSSNFAMPGKRFGIF